eukprot:27696-Prorocentrum_minimum.AAC.2
MRAVRTADTVEYSGVQRSGLTLWRDGLGALGPGGGGPGARQGGVPIDDEHGRRHHHQHLGDPAAAAVHPACARQRGGPRHRPAQGLPDLHASLRRRTCPARPARPARPSLACIPYTSIYPRAADHAGPRVLLTHACRAHETNQVHT